MVHTVFTSFSSKQSYSTGQFWPDTQLKNCTAYRLVQGGTLQEYCQTRVKDIAAVGAEDKMLKAGVQLMDVSRYTVHLLVPRHKAKPPQGRPSC